MDAVTWHHNAVLRPPEPPDPLSLKELHALSPSGRQTHMHALGYWLFHRYIESQALRDYATELDMAWTYNAMSLAGSKSILAVTAPNTVGKSTLVRRWARAIHRQEIGSAGTLDVPPRWNPDPQTQAALIPVAWINLEARAKIAELNTQILQFTGYPRTGQIRVMTDRVVAAIARHRLRLLVVDDVHLLKTSHRDGQDVLDHLKHLNTELGEQGGTLLLIGANLEDTDLVDDPQIARRLKLISMEPFHCDINDKKKGQIWQTFLAEVEEELLPYFPAGEPGMLSRETAATILNRTQGYMGDIAALLNDAAWRAALDGTWKITSAHLTSVKLSLHAMQEEALRRKARR